MESPALMLLFYCFLLLYLRNCAVLFDTCRRDTNGEKAVPVAVKEEAGDAAQFKARLRISFGIQRKTVKQHLRTRAAS